jgi:3-hydroxyisobutyrate dehydrogenase-like beta-hydroxyacid dehydrogenase
MILSIIETLSESMILAEKSGVGAELLYEFVKEFLPAPSFIGCKFFFLNQVRRSAHELSNALPKMERRFLIQNSMRQGLPSKEV